MPQEQQESTITTLSSPSLITAREMERFVTSRRITRAPYTGYIDDGTQGKVHCATAGGCSADVLAFLCNTLHPASHPLAVAPSFLVSLPCFIPFHDSAHIADTPTTWPFSLAKPITAPPTTSSRLLFSSAPIFFHSPLFFPPPFVFLDLSFRSVVPHPRPFPTSTVRSFDFTDFTRAIKK